MKVEQSNIVINNPSNEEQFLLIGVPNDPQKSAVDISKDIVQKFRAVIPDLVASNWQTLDKGETETITFGITFTDGNKNLRGDVMLLKGANTVTWLSYSAESTGYSKEKALGLILNIMSSMAEGGNSKPPSGKIQEAAPPVAESKPLPEKEILKSSKETSVQKSDKNKKANVEENTDLEDDDGPDEAEEVETKKDTGSKPVLY